MRDEIWRKGDMKLIQLVSPVADFELFPLIAQLPDAVIILIQPWLWNVDPGSCISISRMDRLRRGPATTNE